MTPMEKLHALIEAYGSQRAAALAIGMNITEMNKIVKGNRPLSEKNLALLGFKKVISYELLPGPADADRPAVVTIRKEPVNMHGAHVASCLCCAYLDMGYEGDWSEVTPGRGYYCDCNKGHFCSLDTGEYHKLITLGRNCVDFVVRITAEEPA